MASSDIALVFDLDNTLVHSVIDFPAMRRRVIETARSARVSLPDDTVLHALATAEVIEAAIAGGASAVVEAEIWSAVTDEETRGMERATVEDDAVTALRTLREAGAAIALLTNNALAAATAALERFALLEHIDLVLARDNVPALKPSPAGILHAQSVLPYQRMAMIGDATIDGLAANRAAVPFIAFRPRLEDMDRRGVSRWATIQTLTEIAPLLPHLPPLPPR